MPEPPLTVLVIGAGFSGLALGRELRRREIGSFLILEKAARLGGTWRANVYPGAACDIPSFSYCLSYEQKTDWTRKWAPQAEILAYMEHFARKHRLNDHLRCGVEVTSAAFDETEKVWRVQTRDGQTFAARHLVSGVGQLSRPLRPTIEGLETFGGTLFHSAEWDPEFEAQGKRIAVIGNAASAVQLVPELAKTAARLHVLQRSANWILAKNDRVYSRFERAAYSFVPLLARLYRWLIWFLFEARFGLFQQKAWAVNMATGMVTRHLEAQVPDPELRKKLTPDYPVGAKRILTSDDYYPALQRPNVELVTAPIAQIDKDGVILRDGQRLDVDAIVLATGFATTEFLSPVTIAGRRGRTLTEAWADGASAYLGMTVPGFPNFFIMYGPNTNLGHNSILFMLECQARYITGCILRATRRGAATLELRPVPRLIDK
jgi:cation diffusion facilitator CzcD-associated flavoprotein CzcO